MQVIHISIYLDHVMLGSVQIICYIILYNNTNLK
jgi:hypothetical protein